MPQFFPYRSRFMQTSHSRFRGGAGGKNTQFIAVLTKGPSDGALEKVWILFIVAINSMTKKVTYRFCVPRLDG